MAISVRPSAASGIMQDPELVEHPSPIVVDSLSGELIPLGEGVERAQGKPQPATRRRKPSPPPHVVLALRLLIVVELPRERAHDRVHVVSILEAEG